MGAEVGVGLSEGTSGGLSWRVLTKTALGWVWTILLSLAFCAALFSAGAYAPSITQTQQLAACRTSLLSAQEGVLEAIDATNAQWAANAAWVNGTVAAPMRYNGGALPRVITSTLASIQGLKAPKKHVSTEQVLYYVAQASALYQNHSITAIGQMDAPAVVAGSASYVAL